MPVVHAPRPLSSSLSLHHSSTHYLTGTIDPKELKAASLGINAKNQTIKQIVADIEKDGKDLIGFDEFMAMMMARMVSQGSLISYSLDLQSRSKMPVV